MKAIDPHVHLRDWNHAHKETIAHAVRLAWDLGISALFEMPNTDPPLTSRESVLRRIAYADRAVATLPASPFHGLYVGLTSDPDQVRHAAALRDELFPRVVGCKLYAGHSTGRMGVTTVAEQFRVWRALVIAGYRGVVAVHAEREDLLRRDLHDKLDPLTYAASRPPLAEIASIQTQLALAEAAGFRGILHFCHVSTPDSLETIHRERPGIPFTITAGVTPHHLLLDTEIAAASEPSPGRRAGERPDGGSHPGAGESATVEARPAIAENPGARGSGFTVNPPLRDRSTRRLLWERVVDGGADWIESDHAPHTAEEKRAGAAGLPGIPAFRYLAEELTRYLDPPALYAMTGGRVLEVFGINPEVIPEHPGIPENTSLRSDYASRENAGTGPEETSRGMRGSAEYPWDPYVRRAGK